MPGMRPTTPRFPGGCCAWDPRGRIEPVEILAAGVVEPTGGRPGGVFQHATQPQRGASVVMKHVARAAQSTLR
eukprot:4602722-Alexandrium_andersonii.AAC.1